MAPKTFSNKFVFLILTILLAIAAGIYFGFVENMIRGACNDEATLLSPFITDPGQLSIAYCLSKSRNFFFLGVGCAINLTVLLIYHNQREGIGRFLDVEPTSLRALAILLLNFALGTFYLIFFGWEGSWYILSDVSTFAEDPPYQHRIFFVLIANSLQWILPGLSVLWAFYVSQMISLLAALLALRLLAAHFFDRGYAYLAYYFLILMWVPTVSYYTYYDIGIIAFYSLALYYLFKEKYFHFIAVFAIGTLNHELILFLLCISGIKLLFEKNFRILMQVSAAGLALYALIRLALFTALPADRAWSPDRVLLNIQRLVDEPVYVLMSLLPLMTIFIVSLIAVRRADRDIQYSVVLLPMLFLMTFLFGQFNEARQFVAFIPIATCLLITLVAPANRTGFHEKS